MRGAEGQKAVLVKDGFCYLTIDKGSLGEVGAGKIDVDQITLWHFLIWAFSKSIQLSLVPGKEHFSK